MEEIRSIVARFPKRELDIRRRCARDAHFRSICADYEEATAAFRYWQQTENSDRRAEEYARFLSELEAEILDHLNHDSRAANINQRRTT